MMGGLRVRVRSMTGNPRLSSYHESVHFHCYTIISNQSQFLFLH